MNVDDIIVVDCEDLGEGENVVVDCEELGNYEIAELVNPHIYMDNGETIEVKA